MWLSRVTLSNCTLLRWALGWTVAAFAPREKNGRTSEPTPTRAINLGIRPTVLIWFLRDDVLFVMTQRSQCHITPPPTDCQ